MKSEKVLMSMYFEENREDKKVTLSYTDEVPHKDILTVISLYQSYFTSQRDPTKFMLIGGAVLMFMFIPTHR